MILKPVTDCDRDFDFFPLRSWSAILPPYAWRGQLVCGFDRRAGLAVELNTCDLTDLLAAVYDKFNVFELARWWQIGTSRSVVGNEIDIAKLCEMSGFKWNDHLEGTLRSIAPISISIQHWCEEKKWTAGDVQILRALPDLAAIQPAFEKLIATKATRAQGVEILEIIGELILLAIPWADTLAANTSAEGWLQNLRKLRHPRAAQSLDSKNRELMKAPWPKSTSAKWLRKGDRLKLEVVVEADDGVDLARRLQQLESLSHDL